MVFTKCCSTCDTCIAASQGDRASEADHPSSRAAVQQLWGFQRRGSFTQDMAVQHMKLERLLVSSGDWDHLQGRRGKLQGRGAGGKRVGRGADHLVGGPEGDDLNVPVLIGDGVAVPQPVKVMNHSTAATHHTSCITHHASCQYAESELHVWHGRHAICTTQTLFVVQTRLRFWD